MAAWENARAKGNAGTVVERRGISDGGTRGCGGRDYFLTGFAATDCGSVNGKNCHGGLLLRKVSVVIPTAPGPGAGAAGSAFNGITLRKACQTAVGAGPNSRIAS